MGFRHRHLGFMEYFCKTTCSQENEMNRKSKKYSQKPLGFCRNLYHYIIVLS